MANPTSHDLADYTSEDDEDLQAPRNMQRRRFIVEDSDDEDQITSSSSSQEVVKMQCSDENQVGGLLGHFMDAHEGDLDEDLQPPPKMQRRRFIVEDSDDEDQMVSPSNSDGDWDDSSPENDDELVGWIPYPYRADKNFDKLNDREVYSITVEDEAFGETDRRRMLDDVECGDHFIGCSVENCFAFYARLNKKEADKLKGVKGVFLVVPYRCIFRDA